MSESSETEQRWKQFDEIILKNYQTLRNNHRQKITEYINIVEARIQDVYPSAILKRSTESSIWSFDSIVNVTLTSHNEALMSQLANNPSGIFTKLWRHLLERGISGTGNLRLIMLDGIPIQRRIAISDGHNYLAEKAELLEQFCQYAPDRLPQLAVWVNMWAEACDISCYYDDYLLPYALMIMLINYLQNCSPPVLPFFRHDLAGNILLHSKFSYSSATYKGGSQAKNTMSVAQLFHGFLEYLLIFSHETHVFQITREKPVRKVEMGHKRWLVSLAIEDPLDVKENLGKKQKYFVVNHLWKIVQHTVEVLLTTKSEDPIEIFKQCSLGEIPRQIVACSLCGKWNQCRIDCPNTGERFDKYFDGMTQLEMDKKNHRELKQRHRQQERMYKRGIYIPVVEKAIMSSVGAADQSKNAMVGDQKSNSKDSPQPPKDNISLQEAISTFNIKSKDEWKELDKRIYQYYRIMTPSQLVYTDVFNFVDKLQSRLTKTMPGAKLLLHGPIISGFFCHDRSVNICFQDAGEDEPDGVDYMETLKSLTKVFSNWKFDTIIPETRSIICNAKDNSLRRKIYISYYSTMRVYLSKLMAKYCEWDDRVAPLGVFIKNWAKGLERKVLVKPIPEHIWLIMMVHYLQNCDIPVLPRLQEDFITSETQPCMVMERGFLANVYFHQKVQVKVSKNTKSVAELFYGFLDYFANFDYKNMVIQIRRKLPVHKLEKEWLHIPFCVEEPFKPLLNITFPQDGEGVDHIFNYIKYSRDTFMTAGPVSAFKILSSCKMNYIPEEVPPCSDCGNSELCIDECPNHADRYALYFKSKIRYGAPLRPKDLLLYNKTNTTKPVPDDDTIMKTFEESLKRRMQGKQ